MKRTIAALAAALVLVAGFTAGAGATGAQTSESGYTVNVTVALAQGDGYVNLTSETFDVGADTASAFDNETANATGDVRVTATLVGPNGEVLAQDVTYLDGEGLDFVRPGGTAPAPV